jgi:transcriptional regulator with XRE-family HTH domain
VNDITPRERIAEVRKRRGLSQRELAGLCGWSLSYIKKIEQGADGLVPRLETLHVLAQALRVPTSTLTSGGDADGPDEQTAEDWTDVRAAIYGLAQQQPDDQPTEAGILDVLASVKPALAANHFGEVRTILPGLIRDAGALNGAGRVAQSKVLNLTAWLLTQTRQWDDAAVAAQLAADAADDRIDAAASVNTACWALLRQGRLSEARDLATAKADDIEPRFSRATTAELGVWGRLLLNVSNAAVRDNRPGEAQDALSLAAAAAGRIGREVTADGSTTRTFGPVTVQMIAAENAAISRNPLKVLDIAAGIPAGVLHPTSASRCRHQLDVASAYVQLRQYAGAVAVLLELRRDAPEWLLQQRYARDIIGSIVRKRRTLTGDMRALADAVRLPL